MTNSFVIGAAVGELEFEVEENELTLTVDNMVGEWAIFLPTVAGQAGAEAGGTAATSCPSLAELLLQVLSQQNVGLAG